MSSRRHTMVSIKACTRCRTQKRRCDRALPKCGLCTRLGQVCEYDVPRVLSTGPTSSTPPGTEMILGPFAFSPEDLRDAIIQRLSQITPEDIFSAYDRGLKSWFPIVSLATLRSQLPVTRTWGETPLDVALVCLSIVLLSTSPTTSIEDDNHPSDFRCLYLFLKSSIASAEGLGVNSFSIVQSRILVTLFEVAHGFHSTAYISIGATIRAADALEMQPGAISLISNSLDEGTDRGEATLAWCGILILDRFITIGTGPHPSLTRSRSQRFYDSLKPIICSTNWKNQDNSSSIGCFSRLFEASSLLDKTHMTLNSPTAEFTFNMEELILIVQTVINLQTILNGEIGDGTRLYSGGLYFCNIALLVAFEDGSKVPSVPGLTDNCQSISRPSLESIISSITSAVEPITQGTGSIDLQRVPPFGMFLVYKAAAILTENLLVKGTSIEDLRKLKILRTFLRMSGKRWLISERYLKLLDEDTTPRILRAVESGL